MGTINDKNGTPMVVTPGGKARVYAVIESEEHHANESDGLAFTWQFSEDADANDDCIFYLKNTDSLPLMLEGIDLYVTSDAEVYLKVGGSGTTAAGTDVVGANLNPGSGNVADVTCIKDGDVEAGGTFSGATECKRYKYTEGTTYDTHHINFPMDIILPKNQVFTVWCDTAAVVIMATLYGYFHAEL